MDYIRRLLRHRFDARNSDRMLVLLERDQSWLAEVIANREWRELFYELSEAHEGSVLLELIVKVGCDRRRSALSQTPRRLMCRGADHRASSTLAIGRRFAWWHRPPMIQWCIARSSSTGSNGSSFSTKRPLQRRPASSRCVAGSVGPGDSASPEPRPGHAQRIAAHSLHGFLYAMSVLRLLALDPSCGRHAGALQRLQQSIVASFTGSRRMLFVVHVQLMLAGGAPYPSLCGAIANIVATGDLNVADVSTVLASYTNNADACRPPLMLMRLFPSLLQGQLQQLFDLRCNLNPDFHSRYLELLAIVAGGTDADNDADHGARRARVPLLQQPAVRAVLDALRHAHQLCRRRDGLRESLAANMTELGECIIGLARPEMLSAGAVVAKGVLIWLNRFRGCRRRGSVSLRRTRTVPLIAAASSHRGAPANRPAVHCDRRAMCRTCTRVTTRFYRR